MIKKKIGILLLCTGLATMLSADVTHGKMKEEVQIKSMLNKSDTTESFMKKLQYEFPYLYIIFKDYQELSKDKKSIEDMQEFATTVQYGILVETLYSIPVIYNSYKKYLIRHNLDFMYLTKENLSKITLTDEYKDIYKREIFGLCKDDANKNRVVCEKKN